ncbi:MAG TPA: type I restriction enzyme HsdR N-terminal domain-containing protein, partial [Bacteroidales bacterium]|nr:type I restriction enzyme HsdR N-terminal domain-containing protein [Bacteroidales bacterium]
MLKQRIVDGKIEIFDTIRKKWILLTEEERVRQLFIQFMIQEKKIPVSFISVERKICVNNIAQRYDIVVHNRQGEVMLVVECKAPEVAISQKVVEQVGRYNKTLRAPVIGVTNGEQ